MVVPQKPILGFDLKFHAGYEISIPLKELAGAENLLTIILRVTPQNPSKDPVYLTQKIRVPSIEEDAKGDAYLQGTFDVGEGNYKVDWLMRDRAERVCANFWDAEAQLPQKDKNLVLTAETGAIMASEREEFTDEPMAERKPGDGDLRVKVLVNFAPQNSNASTLQPMDTSALVSILRSLQRDSRIGKFSVVAFNLQEQKILYRQDNLDHIDLPAIGEAVKNLQLGRVDVAKLKLKNPETDFLGDLIRSELRSSGDAPDAVIIAGPKVMLQSNVPSDTLRTVGEPEYPVFYMNYNLYPQLSPWRDAIGNAVKALKGAEFTISRPRDLFFAWSEIMGRIVKSKFGRTAALPGPSTP